MGKESKGEGETRARRSGGLRRRRGFDRHFQERFLAVPEIGLEEGGNAVERPRHNNRLAGSSASMAASPVTSLVVLSVGQPA